MTTSTINEHVRHPRYRCGRRKPSDKPVIAMAELFTGTLPSRPLVADNFAKVSGWGLYTNDRFGVCGPTGVANSRKLVTAYLTGIEVSPPLDAVYDLYRRSGNPDFDPANGAGDRGVDLKTMLAEVVRGGIGGVKAVAFGSIDPRDPDQLWAAIAIFGYVLFGVDLETAQQAQTDTGTWTYKPSGQWGGHCVLGGQYADQTGTSKDETGVITWARVVEMAASFVAHQVEEAYVLVWPEHLAHPAFLAGVDLPKLAQAFKTLTGKTLNTSPAPAPGPAPADGALAVLRQVVAGIKAGLARMEQVLDDLVS